MVWVGELYYERHRAVYTTQAHNKLWNRQCEFALHDVEMLSALTLALGHNPYPAQELARLWQLVLFNQFHDVLPGSSIREVYQDSDRDYADVLEVSANLRESALQALVGQAAGDNCAPSTHSPGRGLRC